VKGKHYTAARAKKSLVFFGFGKLASAALSIAFLGLTVRNMPIADYGKYIVLLAAMEIFYLTTGFGLSTIAQRYIPDARIHASEETVAAFLWSLVRKRLMFSVVSAAIFCGLMQATASVTSFSLIDSQHIYWLGLIFIVSASANFLEEIIGSLLMQGLSQSLSVGRMVLKLGIVWYLSWQHTEISFQHILMIELITLFISITLGHAYIARHYPIKAPQGLATGAYENALMWPTARRFFFIQLVGQAYGPNVVRILLERFAGLLQTATFGFAQGVADMFRNMLPAHLLAGWIRPLMVSRYLARRDLNDLTDAANLILKLNFMGIVPLLVFFICRGDAFAQWASAGKYAHAGTLLALATVMIGLQTVHLLFSIITITLEQAHASMRATIAAALTLPVQVLLIVFFNEQGACWGILLGELIWLSVATYCLHQRQFHLHWDVRGTAKILACGLLSGICVSMVDTAQPTLPHLLTSALVVGAVFLASTVVMKPLRAEERKLMQGVLPAKFIVW
jgi:O-antigen/teichoic acid export membrane protein